MQRLDLSLRLQPKQNQLRELIEDSEASTLGYGGSRGGGKSKAIRDIMLFRRLKYPGTHGLIFRRVYDDLKKNHIDKFFAEYPALFRFYRATDHEVLLPCPDGKVSRIVFAYAETLTEVKRKFHGPEYMDMFIDQAEQLSEEELKIVKTANRWPGMSDRACKFVLFFNPGGIGLSYLKRIFRDLEYRDKEKASDFEFIQAYGWDNVEWCRSALIEDGKTEDDFYAWSDQERFDYFISRSQYGQQLDSLPPAMRIGQLMGSLDQFEGQYFDLWDTSQHTIPLFLMNLRPWHPRWISIDWGFQHNSAVLWHAQDENVTKTYREFVRGGLGPKALAQEIMDRCRMDGEKEHIDAIYISPDTRAKRTNEDTIIQQIGEVFRQNGFPMPRIADDDRRGGWMLMYEMLKYNRWVISRDCTELIRNIPLFVRDLEGDAEDCLKFAGDDPGDSARYGLKSRFPSREAPRQVQLHNRLFDLQFQMAQRNRSMNEIYTAAHMAHLKFEQEYAMKHRPVRRIRNWRAT